MQSDISLHHVTSMAAISIGLSVAVAFLLHWLAYWLATRIVRRMRIEPVILPALYHPSRWLIVLMTLAAGIQRSEEHTSELQSLMRISYAVFCLKKKT